MTIKLCLNHSHKTCSDNQIGPRLGWSRNRVRQVDPRVSVSTQASTFLKKQAWPGESIGQWRPTGLVAR